MQLSFDIEKNVRSFQQVSEPHFHDGYEVLLCLSDGGKFHVQEQEYPLCRGMMFVLPPKTIHRCVVDIASYERYILHFSPEDLWILSSSQTALQPLFDGCNYYTVLSDEQFDFLSRMLEQCRTQNTEFGRDLQRNIQFMEIILTIGRILNQGAPQAPPRPTKEFARILPLMEYIHGHYEQDISLDFLSQKFFISKYYLCHQFKALTGFGVGAYLNNYRVRQACALLRGGMGVQEAGERVGFKNNAHFIRTFGQIIGVSPGKYVKSLQYK